MTDERITAYLLQELSEEDAERFEEQCFALEEWPAELDSAEEDLIDAYLKKELTAERQRSFEAKYLTTDARKARVLLAQSFLEVLCPVPQKVTFRDRLRPFLQYPLVPQSAVAILVLVVGLTVIVPMMRESRAPQTFTELNLAMSSPDRASGSQHKRVALPLSTDALKIYLKLPEPSPAAVNYRVQWENDIDVIEDLKIEVQDNESVVVVIPADKLTPGKYALKVFRINPGSTEQSVIGDYFFIAE